MINIIKEHWVSFFIGRNLVVYFNSFGIKYTPQEVLNKITDKSITHNMFRIQDLEYNLLCVDFIVSLW